jgi:glycosyltransferase involved in cell wall biosynthesis
MNKDCAFCFVISSYNNQNNIKKNLMSIIQQTYKNWRAIYINDASTDNTDKLFWEIIHKYNVSSKITYIKNDARMFQSYNKYIAYQQIEDLEIACILDGDDWLASNDALSILNNKYNETGSKIICSNNLIYENGKYLPTAFSEYSEIDKINSSIRYTDKWYFSHLKTGYGILFKSIPSEYLKYDNKWLDRCTDLAEMYCVAELSNGKILNIPDKLHIYNKSNSTLYDNSYFNDKDSETRLKIKTHIRTLPICKYQLPKTYIINMKTYYTHKISMMRQMQLINNNYTFIDAVDGNNSEDIDTLYNNAINHYNSTRKPNGKSAIEAFKIIHYTKGALGLIASAFKALEDFIKSDCEDDHMLLLEDDVYTLKEFKNELYMNKELLKNKDLVYLGYHNNKIPNLYDANSNEIYKKITDKHMMIYGAYSIILSKKIVNKILMLGFEFCVNLLLPWDLILRYIYINFDDLNYYLYKKQLFIPEVRKQGIHVPRTIDYYKDNKIELDDYNTNIETTSNATSSATPRKKKQKNNFLPSNNKPYPKFTFGRLKT